jgi:hypothetical protein
MPSPLMDRIRSLAPVAMANLDRLWDVAWASTDAQALELCRLRMAAMVGDERGLARRTPQAGGIDEAKITALPEWWTSGLFSDYEQARISFTEQFVPSVSSVSDADSRTIRSATPRSV